MDYTKRHINHVVYFTTVKLLNMNYLSLGFLCFGGSTSSLLVSPGWNTGYKNRIRRDCSFGRVNMICA